MNAPLSISDPETGGHQRLRVISWARGTLVAAVQRDRAASPAGQAKAGESFRK